MIWITLSLLIQLNLLQQNYEIIETLVIALLLVVFVVYLLFKIESDINSYFGYPYP